MTISVRLREKFQSTVETRREKIPQTSLKGYPNPFSPPSDTDGWSWLVTRCGSDSWESVTTIDRAPVRSLTRHQLISVLLSHLIKDHSYCFLPPLPIQGPGTADSDHAKLPLGCESFVPLSGDTEYLSRFSYHMSQDRIWGASSPR